MSKSGMKVGKPPPTGEDLREWCVVDASGDELEVVARMWYDDTADKYVEQAKNWRLVVVEVCYLDNEEVIEMAHNIAAEQKAEAKAAKKPAKKKTKKGKKK